MPRKPNTPRLDVDVGQEETNPGDGLPKAVVLVVITCDYYQTSNVHCSRSTKSTASTDFWSTNATFDTFGQKQQHDSDSVHGKKSSNKKKETNEHQPIPTNTYNLSCYFPLPLKV